MKLQDFINLKTYSRKEYYWILSETRKYWGSQMLGHSEEDVSTECLPSRTFKEISDALFKDLNDALQISLCFEFYQNYLVSLYKDQEFTKIPGDKLWEILYNSGWHSELVQGHLVDQESRSLEDQIFSYQIVDTKTYKIFQVKKLIIDEEFIKVFIFND